MLKLAIIFLLSPALALAGAILPDGTFHEFEALNVGSPVGGCADHCYVDGGTSTIDPVADITTVPPWTFSGPAILFVIDLFLSGDQYEVFDNGVSLGDTSTPGGNIQCGAINTADIGCSIADPDFSRGTFLLGDGDHSITIDYIVGTYVGHSGGALQLNPVPEPATPFLLAIGLTLLVCAARKPNSRRA